MQVCWDSASGEFLFAKRYCHGSEVSAVDVARADYTHQGRRCSSMLLG